MDAVEKYADSQMNPTDVDLGKETDHFFQRLNDPRNGKEISPAELTGLFKRLARNKKKFLEFLKQYREFVVRVRDSVVRTELALFSELMSFVSKFGAVEKDSEVLDD